MLPVLYWEVYLQFPFPAVAKFVRFRIMISEHKWIKIWDHVSLVIWSGADSLERGVIPVPCV